MATALNTYQHSGDSTVSRKLMTSLTLNLSPVVQLSDDGFYNLYQANRDLKLERTAAGELELCHQLEEKEVTEG